MMMEMHLFLRISARFLYGVWIDSRFDVSSGPGSELMRISQRL